MVARSISKSDDITFSGCIYTYNFISSIW